MLASKTATLQGYYSTDTRALEKGLTVHQIWKVSENILRLRKLIGKFTEGSSGSLRKVHREVYGRFIGKFTESAVDFCFLFL